MKRTLLAAILATAAIAFSCSMEESGSLQSGSVVTEPTVTIAPFVAGVATKTTASFENNVASFAFANGDVLRAYPVAPEQGDGIRFTLKGEPGTTCVFEGSGFGLMEGQEYAAYYPGGSETVPEVTAVPVSFLGQSQPAASEWNLSDVDFLYATGIEPVNGACSFSMKHLGALLIIDVTFEEAGVYKELTLSSDYSFIAKGTVDLTQDDIELAFDEKTDMAETITLALGGDNGMAVEANQTVTFYMMMAPDDIQAQAELTVSIKDVNDKVTVLKQGTGFAFESGKAYKFGSTVEAVDLGNLSANGTANCYIVDVNNMTEDRYYHFDASVAGNGADGAVDWAPLAGAYYPNETPYPAGNTYALTKTVDANNPIWVVFNIGDCVSDVAYDPDLKIISFKATGKEGNAKISLCSAENVAIWTWHIWCTDQPQTITYTTEDTNNTLTIMDRNLGATMASSNELTSVDDIPLLCGLYYQWGRPIPLCPDYGLWEAEWGNMNMYTTFTKPDKWTNTWNGDNMFCLIVPDMGRTPTSKMWGNDANTFWQWPAVATLQKTIYDPCPVGYQVPPTDFLRAYTGSSSDYGRLSCDAHGMYLDNGSGSKVYFPYAGHCNENGLIAATDGNGRFYGLGGGDANNDGSGFWMWTSGNGNSNACWWHYASYWHDYNCTLTIKESWAGSYAASVRCVAEN